MKLYPEDPRLSAYVLGELGAEDAAAVENAAMADPSLQQVIDETAAMQGLLAKRLSISAASLLPAQRENIQRSARVGDAAEQGGGIAAVCNVLKPWLIPAAAVVVLTVTTVILLQMPDHEASPLGAILQVPEPVAAVQPQPVKPVPPWSPHRASVKVADFPTLQLPIQAGRGNLEMIRKSILGDEKLPAIRDVRLEEILNSFELRPAGVTAIARRPAGNWHPDSRDGGVTSHVATLSIEMIACPWKPSATLLLVSLRGNAQSDCEAKLAFRPNPVTVLRYRLLGSNSESGGPISEIASRLPAKTATTLVIEIEPFNADRDFGSLEWSTNDAKAPSISLVRNDEAEPSDDARFAVLVCTYAQWLAGEQVGMIDADIVAALAREVASGKLEADRVEFLSLIDKSLHL
jgi:hypothetical protein